MVKAILQLDAVEENNLPNFRYRGQIDLEKQRHMMQNVGKQYYEVFESNWGINMGNETKSLLWTFLSFRRTEEYHSHSLD